MTRYRYRPPHTQATKDLLRNIRTEDPWARFQTRYEVDLETGCWNWLRGTSGRGYPYFSVENRTVAVHRWIYEFTYQSITAGKQIHHVCHNLRCVNPEHLSLLSPLEHRHEHDDDRGERISASLRGRSR